MSKHGNLYPNPIRQKVRKNNMYEEEYELWVDKDLYFTDFIESHESEDKSE